MKKILTILAIAFAMNVNAQKNGNIDPAGSINVLEISVNKGDVVKAMIDTIHNDTYLQFSSQGYGCNAPSGFVCVTFTATLNSKALIYTQSNIMDLNGNQYGAFVDRSLEFKNYKP